jgi:hypothetical protein
MALTKNDEEPTSFTLGGIPPTHLNPSSGRRLPLAMMLKFST